MPNIAIALKAEIARVARKELKGELAQLRKLFAKQRSDIAELKRRLQEAERAGRRRFPRASAAAEEQDPAGSLRFRAGGLKSHRERLQLSAAQAARLLGVSALTVYHWEKGATRPRRSQMERIAAFRKLGKRQAAAILSR